MSETGSGDSVTAGVSGDAPTPPGRMDTLYERIHAMCDESERLRRTDPRKALRLGEDALELLGDADSDQGSRSYQLARFQCLYSIGHAHERLSDYSAAIRVGQDAMRVAESLSAASQDDTERQQALQAVANACNLLGNTYDRIGDFVMSLHYRRHNMEIATQQGTRHSRAHALLQLAAAYYRLADYPTTLNCYQESLIIFEEVGDKHGEGSAWNGIGNVQYSEGDFAEAAESYQRGLVVFEELDEPYWQAGLLGNIAGAYLEVGQTTEAREAALQSLVLRARIGDRHGQGYSHDTLARIYLKMERPPKAKEAALRSLSLFEEVNDRTGMVYASRTLGRSCMEMREYTNAMRHFRGALSSAESVGLRELVYHLYELISTVYERTDDPVSALEYYKKFHVARESLFNEESDRRLRNLRALHEVDHAKREADLYRQHNRDLEAANAIQSTLLQQLREKSVELEQQARTDSLTGLLNRRHFSTVFAEAFTQASESGQPLSVALLDVDHFKTINDHHSHAAGDAVLTELGRILWAICRPSDIVARYGGEEFAVAFPNTSLEEAVEVCGRLRAATENSLWPSLPPGYRITVSIGVCVNQDIPTPDRLLSLADTHLYEAKSAGRNQVRS